MILVGKIDVVMAFDPVTKECGAKHRLSDGEGNLWTVSVVRAKGFEFAVLVERCLSLRKHVKCSDDFWDDVSFILCLLLSFSSKNPTLSSAVTKMFTLS